MTDTQAARSRLEAQLADLEDRLQRIETDLAEPIDADSSERAVQMEDDQSLEGQAAVISDQIASVWGAIVHIEQGTYGKCLRNARHITAGRLEARHESALYIDYYNRSKSRWRLSRGSTEP